MKKIFTAILVSIMLLNFSAKAQLVLTTDSILQLSTCAGGNIVVPYTVTGGTFNIGNVFKAQLSNNFGQFTNPVTIGTLFFWQTGVILCTIPANTNFGFLYKIRVIATNPADTGTSCPNTLIITQVAQLNHITSNPGDTICTGDSTHLTAINIANHYSWSTGDTTQAIYVNQSGIYTVTTTDILGCQSTTSDTVLVHACTGIRENDLQNAIEVYPNPASGKLNFKWEASGTEYLSIHLYNSLGAEVLRGEKIMVNSVSENQIDISQLTSGIYLLVVDNGNNRVTRKIVVQ